MNTIRSVVASVAEPVDHEPKSDRLIRIRGQIHDYDWGKLGHSSLVASLATEGGPYNFTPKEDHPYAELWMGTHPSGPSTVYSAPSRKLIEHISSDPEHWLGRSTLNRWPDSHAIPYVFKILSIAKALPLQAHPDKKLGEKLHKRDRAHFVDANYKPEIAVALSTPVSDAFRGDPATTTFTGFVGFAPLSTIRTSLTSIPELAQAVGDDKLVREFINSPSKDTLKAVYTALLVRGKESPGKVREAVESLLSRPAHATADHTLTTQLALAKHINEQYPDDVGVFAAPFFMNFFRLKPGEAIYIGADEVHAYLEGDIIECMAASDNVVNAAFVPPNQRDIRTFSDMLTYTSDDLSHWSLNALPLERSVLGRTTKYSPPLEEFEVLRTVLHGQGIETIQAARGPSIAIVVDGNGVTLDVEAERTRVPRGGIVLVAPGHNVSLSEDGEVWWATTQVTGMAQ